jgi:hypothetical protein
MPVASEIGEGEAGTQRPDDERAINLCIIVLTFYFHLAKHIA